MKMRVQTWIVSGCVVLGLASVAYAQDATTAHADAADKDAESQLVSATGNLERAFSDQFIAGNIDRAALDDEIAQVLAATPEQARDQVASHIDGVLDDAAKVAASKTRDERQALSSDVPASGERVRSSDQPLIVGPGFYGGLGGFGLGFGGFGAFGFPGMFPGAFGLNGFRVGAFGFPGFYGAGLYGLGFGRLGGIGW